MSELKPCPFCGSHSEERDDGSDDYDNTKIIGCVNYKCPIGPSTSYDKRLPQQREIAIAEWNTRVADKPKTCNECGGVENHTGDCVFLGER